MISITEIAQALGGAVSEDSDRSQRVTVSGPKTKLAIVDEKKSGVRVLVQDSKGHNINSFPFGKDASAVFNNDGSVNLITEGGIIWSMTVRRDASATMDIQPNLKA